MVSKTTISGILLILLILLMNVQAQNDLADWQYDRAVEAYDSGNCINASIHVSLAFDRYTAEGNIEGISKCNELIPKINDCLRNLGDSYYNEALKYLEFREYGTAREYAEMARDIYLKINDTEGVEKTEQLITSIPEPQIPCCQPVGPSIIFLLAVDLTVSLAVSIWKKLNFVSVFIKVLILSIIAFIMGYILIFILDWILTKNLGVHYTIVYSIASPLTALVFAIILLLSAVIYLYRKPEK